MAEHDKLTKEEAGRKGAEARVQKHSKEELSEQAKKAAQTVEREHPGFHSEIGKKGGQVRGTQKKREEAENEGYGEDEDL